MPQLDEQDTSLPRPFDDIGRTWREWQRADNPMFGKSALNRRIRPKSVSCA
jgi:hypothetical protein